MSVTYLCVWVRVRACGCVTLLIQHTTRMRHSVSFCGLSDSTTFFSTSHKWHDYWETVIEHKMCELISLRFV